MSSMRTSSYWTAEPGEVRDVTVCETIRATFVEAIYSALLATYEPAFSPTSVQADEAAVSNSF